MKIPVHIFRAALLLTFAGIASCTNMFGTGFGIYSDEHGTLQFRSGYAWSSKGTFGDPIKKVILCDVDKIDAVSLDAITGDRFNALYDQIRLAYPNRNCLQLEIAPDGQLVDLTANTQTGYRQAIAGKNSDPKTFTFKVQHNDSVKIEAALKSTDVMKTTAGTAFDLHFALPVAPTSSEK